VFLLCVCSRSQAKAMIFLLSVVLVSLGRSLCHARSFSHFDFIRSLVPLPDFRLRFELRQKSPLASIVLLSRSSFF
jgi:hypothetical protein